jgi:hypothetical protein
METTPSTTPGERVRRALKQVVRTAAVGPVFAARGPRASWWHPDRWLVLMAWLSFAILVLWPQVTPWIHVTQKTIYEAIGIRVGLSVFLLALLIASTYRRRGLRDWNYCNRYTITATLLCLFVLWLLPQVYNLFRVPPLGRYPWWELGEVVVLYAALGFFLQLYLNLAYAVTPRTQTPPLCGEVNGEHQGPPCMVQGLTASAVSPPSGWFEHFAETLVRCAEKVRPLARRVLGMLLILGAAAWVAIPWLLGRDWSNMGEFSARLGFGILGTLTGVWLLTIPERVNAAPSGRMGFVRNMLGRALWFLLLTSLLGELIWLGAGRSLFSNRVYTLWAVLQAMFLVVAYARVFDAWHVITPYWPIRLIGLVPLVIALAVLGPYPVGKAGAPSDTAAAARTWLDRFQRRLDAMPAGGPVVVVAASGGGSRAALNTALVLESLSHIDSAGHLVDGSPGQSLHQRIALISGVSGGSLATAYYAALHESAGGPPALPRRAWRNATQGDLVRKMLATSAYYEDSFRQSNPDEHGMLTAHDHVRTRCEAFRDAEAAADSQTLLPWPLDSAFADDMGTDFMAPLLRGVLHPGLERGFSVSRLWQERFGWDGKSSVHDKNPDALLPIVLNACDVKSGRRLVIGFPPVSLELLAEPGAAAAGDPVVTASVVPLDPGYEFSLAEGVRLSANFPWAFEVARTKGLSTGGDADELHILDGGIVDNTGLDTITLLFKTIKRLAASGRADLKRRAGPIMRRLRDRKVLLVLIDSGAKAGEPSWLERKFSTVFEPVRCLENAGSANSRIAFDRNLRDLEDVFADSPAEPNAHTTADPNQKRPVRLQSAVFTCNADEDVMTAWALGGDDKAKVIVQFLTQLEWNTQPDLNPRRCLKELIGALGAQQSGVERREDRKALLEHAETWKSGFRIGPQSSLNKGPFQTRPKSR